MILRHRGKLAMLFGAVAFAIFPLSVTADHTLMLEPYLIFFCLLGLLIGFDGGEIAPANRLFFAGLCFGIGSTVKIWAIFPAAVFMVLLIVSAKQALKRFLQGLAVGFLVLVAPFLIASPGSLVGDVFLAQQGRISLLNLGAGIGGKLLDITGLAGFGSLTPPQYVGVLVTVAGTVGAAYLFRVSWPQTSRFDRFVLLATPVVLIGMLSSSLFSRHYACFPAAFIALLVGICLDQAVIKVGERFRRTSRSSWQTIGFGPRIVAVGIGLCLLSLVVHSNTQYADSYLASSSDNGSTLAAVIPPGSCVISDQVSYLIDSNRFTPSESNCPSMVDWYGTWLVDDPGNLPPTSVYSGSLVATWAAWLARADYVVLFSPESDAYPRTPEISALFARNYRLVYAAPGTYTYCDLGRRSSSAADARAALTAGIAEENRQDLSTAAADYEMSLALEPCAAAPMFDLGTVNQTRGNTDAAIALYQEVLAIYPGYRPAATNLSSLESSQPSA